MTHTQLIEKSEVLIKWFDRNVDGLEVKNERRRRLAAACFAQSLDHQKAIVLLTANKLYGPAFSLVRLIFESYVRGVWIHRCADESKLEKFANDKVPDFYLLLEDVEKLKSHDNKVLSRMKKRSWKNMNSYTHTGYLQAARQQTENSIEPNYDDEEIGEVVDFANSIGFLTAIAISDLAENTELANTLFDKMKREWAPE